ncbi:SMI1/KNR4 family protein [Massilia scottii]|uniref:SMI1/KNR4 family protein n=1 Tax=Massilia scottii TaxID=3057166 RepID=UPI002796C6D4|nr:SMI1/KNR4 family protein [Massilia sp. CCM 9029]MDQ1832365.1 SMI1/KNR4 family protein [Massilia sp. CCM 9029]
MRSMWTRFEIWLSEHWPEGLAGLNPPATDEQIASLEDAIGIKLPEDYVACLKIHNGQNPEVGGLFDGSEFLSTDDILAQWTVWKGLLDGGDFVDVYSDPASGVQKDWWNARWIPFTHNGCGDHLCLDLAPEASGSLGQVITMWHDSGERELAAPSFGSWFKSYTKRVFSGDMVYSDEYGGLINREDAELS